VTSESPWDEQVRHLTDVRQTVVSTDAKSGG
jgi:hypothetical protein